MSRHLQLEHISEDMHECIDRCSDCHDLCLATLVYSLHEGGRYAASEHIRTLLDCAQACDTSRDFMLRGSALHRGMCGMCAEACDRCADSCERLDNDVTRRCAEACRRCAESCRAMAG